jgi:hypothetical protein
MESTENGDINPHVLELKKRILDKIKSDHNDKVNKTNIGKAAKSLREQLSQPLQDLFDQIIKDVKQNIYIEYKLESGKPAGGGDGKKSIPAKKKPNGSIPSQEEVLRVVTWFMGQMSSLKHET